ncbi:MAG TPA: polysaccharide deacetylase family protein [Planctomycetota bacterium]|nr:polysaccharide deacetylase family protein [Planctomycetota bacterium]
MSQETSKPPESDSGQGILWPSGQRPILIVLIDAEEEFDWSRAFDRSATGTTSTRQLLEAQALFDSLGVSATYVVTYPVAADPESSSVLRHIAARPGVTIGAHLHPWVTPPFEELVSVNNSYPGNLDGALEREKLRCVCQAIRENIGVEPRVYQAGRYGFGPRTATTLEELGFVVDFSPAPPFDYRSEGGPNFSDHGVAPRWIGSRKEILSVAVTGAYVGFVQNRAHEIYRIATHPAMKWARLPAVFSRLGAIDRLRLSPEGFELSDLERLTRVLLERDVGIFTLSFHAPSLLPGCTPYVKNLAEREQFLARLRGYIEFFLGELGGESISPIELRRRLLPPTAQPSLPLQIPRVAGTR